MKPRIDEEDEHTTISAKTDMKTVYYDGLSEDEFFTMVQQTICVLNCFSSNGSGWVLEKINNSELKIVKFNPIRGSSYLALSSELVNNRHLLNIRNINDSNCFLYCYTAAYHMKYGPVLESTSWRTITSPALYKRTNTTAHQAQSEYEMPMAIDKIDSFETFEQVNENVFRYHIKQLLPLRVSKKRYDLVLDVLLISDGQRYHYVLIKNLEKLIANIRGTKVDYRSAVCRNCFHLCSSSELLKKHQDLCYDYDAAFIAMPIKKELTFKKHKAKMFSPIVVYYDLECILEKVHSVSNDPEKCHSRIIEKHTPSGYCFASVEHNKPGLYRYRLQRGPDCMVDFVDQMEKLARDFYYRKQQHRVFSGTIPINQQKSNAKNCWICERDFVNNDIKVLDHCHFSGKFLGWAHDVCNVNRKTQNFTPVIAHDLSHYDLHHLCNSLHKCHPRNKFTIIPNTDETDIRLTLKVFIEEHLDRRNRLIQVF